jgi:hypothetical protein
VADYGNYGDEPEAVDLLFPSTYTEMGISEQDFQVLRSKSEIQSLFSKVGINLKVGKFNTIYNRARELQKTDSDQVSVRSFMVAIQ